MSGGADASPASSERRAIVALGGNLGDRAATLRRAMREIGALDGVRLIAASSLYETPAMTLAGVDEQAPRYLNAVVEVRTTLAPHELLRRLQSIETRLGRLRVERWGSRTLDLDLIDVEGVELASESLELPHPEAWRRGFVLVPWHEIDPDAQLRGHGTIAALASSATDRVELFAEAGIPEVPHRHVSTDRGLPLIIPDSPEDGRS